LEYPYFLLKVLIRLKFFSLVRKLKDELACENDSWDQSVLRNFAAANFKARVSCASEEERHVGQLLSGST
jgi:hypothetical protein